MRAGHVERVSLLIMRARVHKPQEWNCSLAIDDCEYEDTNVTHIPMMIRRDARASRGPTVQTTLVWVCHVVLVVTLFLTSSVDAFRLPQCWRAQPSPSQAQQTLADYYSRIHQRTTERIARTVLYSNVFRAVEGTGVPSNRGWKSGRLNKLADWTVAEETNRPVICEYEPQGWWLWTKWAGTVLSITWRSVLLSMIMGAAVDYWARSVRLVPTIAVVVVVVVRIVLLLFCG